MFNAVVIFPADSGTSQKDLILNKVKLHNQMMCQKGVKI